jgi:hypothetical protein
MITDVLDAERWAGDWLGHAWSAAPLGGRGGAATVASPSEHALATRRSMS